MESFKKFDTVSNPNVKPFFKVEDLHKHDDYIKKVNEEVRRYAIKAWQKTKDIILDKCLQRG